MSWLPFLLLGAGAHGVQTVLLRELLALSNGSEPAVAFGLGGWLLLAILGSVAGDRLARGKSADDARRRTLVVLLAIPSAALLGLLAARFGKLLVPVEPGNPLPLLWLGAVSLVACGLPALVDGMAFPLLLACRRSGSVAEGGGIAYAGDALGTAAAGVLLSFVLLGLVPGFALAWCFACLPVLGIPALLDPASWRRHRPLCALAGMGALVVAASICRLDRATRSWLWDRYQRSPMGLLDVEEGPQGVVETVCYQGAVSVYRDGLLDISLPDEQTRDDLAHAAMLQVDMPGPVLLVNTLPGATLWHVLDHRPSAVQCVDAPPDLVPSLRGRMCPRQIQALDSPVVRRVVADPLEWLRKCDERFAVVLVRAPDPLSLGTARTCSSEFLGAAWHAVAEHGVLAFGPIPGGGPMGGGLFLERNRTIHDTFQQATGHGDVTGGDAPWLLARQGGEPVDLDFVSLYRRSRERGIVGFSPAAICHEFSRERSAFELRYAAPYNPLATEVPDLPAPSMSSLLAPRVAAQTLQAWLQVTRDRAAGLLGAEGGSSPWWWLLALVPGLLALPTLRRHRRLPLLLLGTYAAGFWSAVALWGVLCAFQTTHGSLYRHLAVLNGTHMLGMGLAATAFSRRGPLRLVWFAALSLLSAGALLWLRTAAAAVPFWGTVLLAAASGALPGAAFAVASGAPPARGLPGTLYAADLAGGLAGFAVGVCLLLPRATVLPPAAMLCLPVLILLALSGDLREAARA